jgi:DNA repair protein RecO
MARVLEVRLIEQQGLRPDFDSCCRCGNSLGKEGPRFFSGAEGGFLCKGCLKEAPGYTQVNPGVAGLWQGLENLAMDKLQRLTVTQKQLEELGGVTRLWISRHAGRPMKTWSML